MDKAKAMEAAFEAACSVATIYDRDKLRRRIIAYEASLAASGFVRAPKEATAEMLARVCPQVNTQPTDDDRREAAKAALILNTSPEWWDRAVEQASLLRVDYRAMLTASQETDNDR